jgi:hypothetical protein
LYYYPQNHCILRWLVKFGVLAHPRYTPSTQATLAFLTAVFGYTLYWVDQMNPSIRWQLPDAGQWKINDETGYADAR